MDSVRNWWGRTLLLSGGAAATAGLFYLGTRLHPTPWLTAPSGVKTRAALKMSEPRSAQMVSSSFRPSTSKWMTGPKAESSCYAGSNPDSLQPAPPGIPHCRRPLWPHHRRDKGRRRRPSDCHPDSRRPAQLRADCLRPRRRPLQRALPDHHSRLDSRPRRHTCRRTSLTAVSE